MAERYRNHPVADPARFTAREQAVLRRAMQLLERDMGARALPLQDLDAARRYVRLWIGAADIEVFGLVCLNAQHELIAAEEMSRGTLAHTAVYPREIVRAALRHNAGAVILVHNHPSGNAQPSVADRQLTEALKSALSLVDVRVLDHMIATSRAVFSFADSGLM
jgi:DNA repair protein RadC